MRTSTYGCARPAVRCWERRAPVLTPSAMTILRIRSSRSNAAPSIGGGRAIRRVTTRLWRARKPTSIRSPRNASTAWRRSRRTSRRSTARSAIERYEMINPKVQRDGNVAVLTFNLLDHGARARRRGSGHPALEQHRGVSSNRRGVEDRPLTLVVREARAETEERSVRAPSAGQVSTGKSPPPIFGRACRRRPCARAAGRARTSRRRSHRGARS